MKVLRFTASWCGPCKMLSKTLEDIQTPIPFEVVDIDVNPEIAQDYGVRGVPTMIMIDGNTEVKRVTGAKTKSELEAWLNG